ncbi:BTAD domain-containing putative transcriptional regulator [Labrys sedimenti]|uniref:BTAD domain-containing putative transcriptional regulator n=1 Tax=Labrys sedimenti TaxID=3106036 RepID=UPI002ACAC434|nr:BTAD domain-containing putative transcriptional regulator [Labrys sp. ZIDIC5]MDZ5454726.1 BTAD domain-containing putative transcriptional regulator [Labrys sp. ZIDIC5]
MKPESDIVLHLSGVPHMTKPIEGVFPAKGYILIAMLLLSSGKRMSRQAIATLLWEDAPEGKASTNLRQLLARINRCWPQDKPIFQAQGTNLVAGPAADRSDLAEIMRWRNSQVLAERVAAIHRVKGDLLATLDTGGNDLSQWFRGERERFRQRVLSLGDEVLMEMTRFARAQKNEIEEIGERMLMLEPEREETFRVLIEAYGRNNNLEAVSRTFELLKAMMQREFNAEPRAEIVGLVRRILANNPKPSAEVNHRPEDAVGELNAAKESEPVIVRSLAKLPRVALLPPNPTMAEECDPLARVLVEEVANDLSRYRTFAVVAPHSSFGAVDLREPERLDALRNRYLVSSFMVPGDPSLALRLELYPGREILWAAEFRIGGSDLPTAFKLISRQIAVTLATEIEQDQLKRMRADPRPHAYRHYLEGKLLLQDCDLPKLRRARREFRRAADIDRYFAPARSANAQTLYQEWLMLGANDPALLHQARLEADAAISIDPGDGAGYRMAAVVSLNQRDFDTASSKFLEAEVLNPHSADLLLSHADALSHLGDAEAGWKRFQMALDLNPFPPDYYWWSGATIAIRRHDYRGAIELCGRMSSDEPVLRALAISHGLLGNKDIARQYGARIREMYPGVTISDIVNLAPDRKIEDRMLVAEGLRVAGLN